MAPAERLERARSAAEARDFPAFLESLYESRFIDGLIRDAEERRPSLHRVDVHSVVADTVDKLYTDIGEGQPVPDLAAYLLKGVGRRFADLMRGRRRLVTPEGLAEFEAVEVRRDPDRFQGHEFADLRSVYEAPPREELRREATRLTRRLLPRLGQRSVQLVMAYLVDAVEAEREDLPPGEIAEALGLTVGTVKTSMTRGLQRLARIARQEGLADNLLRDMGVVLPEEEEEEDEEEV